LYIVAILPAELCELRAKAKLVGDALQGQPGLEDVHAPDTSDAPSPAVVDYPGLGGLVAQFEHCGHDPQ
jgi:hypothetical protein